MTIQLLFILCQLSILACALVAGVFLTFSDFVMRSLHLAQAGAGIEVMQVINREVFRTLFMVMLIGMSVLSPVIGGLAYYLLDGPVAAFMMAGAFIYGFGVFGVTLVCNVPMNIRLDGFDAESADAGDYWAAVYFPDWTFWNSVRTAASALAAICFLTASGMMVSMV